MRISGYFTGVRQAARIFAWSMSLAISLSSNLQAQEPVGWNGMTCSDGGVSYYYVTYRSGESPYMYQITNAFGCGRTGGAMVVDDFGFTVSRIEPGTNLIFNHFAGVSLRSVWAKDWTQVRFGGRTYDYIGEWDVPFGVAVYLPTQACVTVIASKPFYWTVAGHGSIGAIETCGEPPTFALHPQDAVALPGETVSFQVDAKGTQPLFYSWLFQDQLLSNAFGDSLTLTNLLPVQAGHYRAVATNALGSATSEVAVLTVTAPQPPPLVVSRYRPLATNNVGASNPQPKFALSSAFDGTNFLIGIRGDTNNADAVLAQLLSPAVANVGPPIRTGHSLDGFLDGPRVVWGDANHLVVWTDAAPQHPSTGSDVYAQFISPGGHLAGNAFAVCEAAGDQYARGAASDGTNLLVIWAAADGLRGRRLSAASQLLDGELVFTTEEVEEAAAVTYGGGQYLVAWVEGTDTAHAAKGRLVSTSGQPGNVLQLSQNNSHFHNPISVAFGGGRYMAVWHHNANGEADWNLRGRIVLPDGTFRGDELRLTTGPDNEIAWAHNVVFDGQHFLVVWTAYAGSPGSGPGTVWGRYWSRDGVPVGAAFMIESAGAGTLGLGLSAGGGKVLALINRNAFTSAAEVGARFITRPFVEVAREGPRHIQVTFGGGLQYSSNLQTWMDCAPQSSNLWTNQVGVGSLFFRARADTPAEP